MEAAALALAAGVLICGPARAGSAWLDRLESRLVAGSGQVFPLGQGDAVFYAPLAALWMLDAHGAVTDTAVLRRADGALVLVADNGERVRIGPNAGGDVALPLTPATGGNIHALADFHDRLLSEPLANDLGSLPVGSRFEITHGAGGIVQRADAAGRATLWESYGDRIALTHPDGTITLHGWQELDAALRGETE